MKKVLHFIGSLGMGGTENMLLAYIVNSKSSSLEHEICTLYSGGSLEKDFKSAGIKVHSLNIGSKAFLPLAIGRFSKVVGKVKPDIIHSYLLQENLVARITGKLVGAKTICGKRDTDRYKSFWKTWVDRATLWMAYMNISNSKEGIEELRSYGVPKDRIICIPNGKDLKKFNLMISKEEAKKRIGISVEENVLGTVARLYEFKGHEYLIGALPKILETYPKTKAVLVGEGSMWHSLEELAKKLGVEKNVVFLGERKDIPELLKSFDIFVFPSLREGMPGALMEAMASSLPVIATRIDGNEELVQDGKNGLLIAPRDSADLAKKAIVLLENKKIARKLGENAKKTIEKEFSLDAMVERLDSLYERF